MEDKNLDTMLNEPIVIKGLDNKDYKISPLPFADAFKLADKISLTNLIPAVALVDERQRENLIEILLIILGQNHPEVTRERLLTDRIFNLAHIKKIISVALDINELKK